VQSTSEAIERARSTSNRNSPSSPRQSCAPNDAIKLPMFWGEIHGPKKYAPSDVAQFVVRLQVYFSEYGCKFRSESAKLSALYACFPSGSAASAWFQFEYDDLIDIEHFRERFTEYFQPTREERLSLHDSYLNCRQGDRESVRSYYVRLLKLRHDLKFFGHVISDENIALKFVNGLKPKIHDEVLRIFSGHSDQGLRQLLAEAESEERKRAKHAPAPALRAMPGNKGKRCPFCKASDHASFSECPKVAKRKAEGRWTERPKAPAGEA
jgi:Retrotransposon gag protein